jgi:predicted  nucleic acid-binding Zn-ribbon protein
MSTVSNTLFFSQLTNTLQKKLNEVRHEKTLLEEQIEREKHAHFILEKQLSEIRNSHLPVAEMLEDEDEMEEEG